MACGGCEERRKIISQAVKGDVSIKAAAQQVVKSAVRDASQRVRLLTTRRTVV